MKLTLALQWTQRAKLWAEGAKLRAEGDKLWADAILEIYGDITLEWKFKDGDYDCILENGEHYVAVKDAA